MRSTFGQPLTRSRISPPGVTVGMVWQASMEDGIGRVAEARGRYADAENALFHLLDQTPRSPEFVAFGTAFYQRLNGLSDASLERGHLPRPELAPGLAEFCRRANA